MFIQAHTLRISPSGVRVEWYIYPGVLLIPGTWQEADQDSDGVVSEDEAQVWIAERAPNLAARLDDQPIPLNLVDGQWPSSLGAFQLGKEVIRATLFGEWVAPTGAHAFQFENHFQEATSLVTFELDAQDVTITAREQEMGTVSASLDFSAAGPSRPQRPDIHSSRGPLVEAVLPLTLVEPPTSAGEETERPSAASRPPEGMATNSEPAAILTGLVTSGQLSVGFYVAALAISVALGALHALTPGHGKTLVAAYLVGSKGTMRHAVALGGITTLTHTGSVLALGLLTLLASRYFLPTSVFPILEGVSGGLIIVLGFGLLAQRWRALQPVHHHRHRAELHAHAHATSSRHRYVRKPARQTHSHGHTHGGHMHPGTATAGPITWRSLVTLGVSGGLVPCPDAIAILLVAITVNRIVLGLSLIVAFSLGLALVLILIGIAIVRSARLLSRFDAFGRISHLLPVVSAVVVIMLGVALVAGVLGARASRGSAIEQNAPLTLAELQTATTTPARVAEEAGRIVYLTLDTQGRRQLAVVSLASRAPRLLTTVSGGVRDFAVAPDGKRIVFSVWRDDTGSDLWALPRAGSEPIQLVRCVESACSSPAWLPDGRQIVYGVQFAPLPNAGFSAPALWTLDTTTGETRPLFDDEGRIGINPAVSPDGRWIAYDLPDGRGMGIAAWDDGSHVEIANTMLGMFAWAPDRATLAVSVVNFSGTRSYAQLVGIDIESGDRHPLVPGVEVGSGDRSPRLSPDGSRLAFVREDNAALSDWHTEIWLADAQIGAATPLVQNASFIFSGLDWSPDGAYLIAQGASSTNAQASSSLWLIDAETGAIKLYATPGLNPDWIP